MWNSGIQDELFKELKGYQQARARDFGDESKAPKSGGDTWSFLEMGDPQYLDGFMENHLLFRATTTTSQNAKLPIEEGCPPQDHRHSDS